MRCLALLFSAFSLLDLASPARGQVQVLSQTERSNYLLFERVDVLVSIQNTSGSDLVLENSPGHPWLSFLVSRRNHEPVRPERQSEFAPVQLKAGEQKTVRVNLTPLFAFREEGQYGAEAVIDLPGAGQFISPSAPFTVLRGRSVWSQLRAVDGSQRIYSLIRFSPDSDTTRLYLRVENPAENLVYANVGLGAVVASIDPDVNFDPQGNLHILQPVSMGTYLYSRADPDGKILHQTLFRTDHEIPPRLAKLADGNVIVAGGLAENPNSPREKLSDGQSGQSAAGPAASAPRALPADSEGSQPPAKLSDSQPGSPDTPTPAPRENGP